MAALRSQRGRTMRGPPTALFKKGPVIGDGSQSREETLGKVDRFAAALCVAIHTRTGYFFEMRLGRPMSAGDGLSSLASARIGVAAMPPRS
jgi:hypothetical protein